MMNKLKKEFVLGFQEGWTLFWSPIVGLMRAVSARWQSRKQEHVMLVFLDTEFTDLSLDPRLISIGLVTEGGEEFYAELYDAYETPRTYSPFVQEFVLPHLAGGDSRISMDALTLRLGNWLESFEQPVIMATDSVSWDWPWIQKLFVLPGTWPENVDRMPVNLHDLIGSPFLENTLDQVLRNHYPKLRRHHALDDAKANRLAWLDWTERNIDDES